MTLAKLLDVAITLYMWIVIIRVLISWFDVNPYNPYIQFLMRITEPVLYRIRRFLPNIGGLDLSPMILILGLIVAESFLVSTLKDLAIAVR
jgi:YggT family protein